MEKKITIWGSGIKSIFPKVEFMSGVTLLTIVIVANMIMLSSEYDGGILTMVAISLDMTIGVIAGMGGLILCANSIPYLFNNKKVDLYLYKRQRFESLRKYELLPKNIIAVQIEKDGIIACRKDDLKYLYLKKSSLFGLSYHRALNDDMNSDYWGKGLNEKTNASFVKIF